LEGCGYTKRAVGELKPENLTGEARIWRRRCECWFFGEGVCRGERGMLFDAGWLY
jgi:hypothetical protein